MFSRMSVLFLPLASFFSSALASQFVPFTRDKGTIDAMYWIQYNDHGAWPIHQSPVFGIEHDSKTKHFRLLTVRIRDEAIVVYSNNWVVGYASDKRWRVRCPRNMLMMGLACPSGNCDNVELLCGIAGNGFRVVPKIRKVVMPADSNIDFSCPDAMYAQGVECFGKGCTRIGFYCVQVTKRYSVQRLVPLSATHYRKFPSNIFGNSGGKSSWIMNGPVYAIGCFGDSYNCDRKQLYSFLRGLDSITSSSVLWRGPVSATGTSVSCPTSTLITAMSCEKEGCGTIHVACAALRNENKYRFNEKDVKYSNTFSMTFPHDRVGTCPDGYFARGIDCLRDFCSVMMIRCVKVSVLE